MNSIDLVKDKSYTEMSMNKRQVAQTIIGIGALILIIFWLFSPSRITLKLLGIISMALVFTSMLLSFLAEEKKKRDSNELKK